MPVPRTFDELMDAVLEILPGATLGEDDDGQIIVYTNMREAAGDASGGLDGQIEEMEG